MLLSPDRVKKYVGAQLQLFSILVEMQIVANGETAAESCCSLQGLIFHCGRCAHCIDACLTDEDAMKWLQSAIVRCVREA